MSEMQRIIELSNRHTIMAPAIAALLFISFVVGASWYADALLYDYSPNHIASGIGVPTSFSKPLVHYDTNHFLLIAERGYATLGDHAFLPAYPLIVRAIERTTPLSYIWSAIVASWLALIAASVMLYKLFDLEFKARKLNLSPWLPLGLLALFPTSIYLALPYSESLFVFLTASSLYFYKKGNYWLVVPFAALASATRYQGVLLGLFFAADLMLSKRRDYRKLIPIVCSVLGLAAFMIFLKIQTGSYFEFLTAEKDWGRLNGNYIINLVTSFRPIQAWFLLITVLGLKYIWDYLEKPYFIYGLAFILLPLSSGRFEGINRYMVALIPLFLALAISNHRKGAQPLRLGYLLSSTFLLAWGIIVLANNYLVG